MMNIFRKLSLLLVISVSPQVFSAQDASIKISFPADGATLMKAAKNDISFEAMPGERGDHLHLYVDDSTSPVIIRKLKGSNALPQLEAGNHNICLKLVDKGHTPVGTEKCIKIKTE